MLANKWLWMLLDGPAYCYMRLRLLIVTLGPTHKGEDPVAKVQSMAHTEPTKLFL